MHFLSSSRYVHRIKLISKRAHHKLVAKAATQTMMCSFTFYSVDVSRRTRKTPKKSQGRIFFPAGVHHFKRHRIIDNSKNILFRNSSFCSLKCPVSLYKIYYSGFFDGVPAFRGYSIDVPFTLSITIKERPDCPNSNFTTEAIFPPRRNTALLDAATSSSHSPDL